MSRFIDCSEVRLACHSGYMFVIHVALTPSQVGLLKETYSRISRQNIQMSDLFYDRLFTLSPELRSMFPEDLGSQKNKFMNMIGVFVSKIEQPNFLNEEIQDLGRRHVSYNVRPEHYDLVREALLWTIERMLGNAFTPDVKAAWEAAYDALALVMQENAHFTLSKEKSLDRMVKGGMVANYGLDPDLDWNAGGN